MGYFNFQKCQSFRFWLCKSLLGRKTHNITFQLTFHMKNFSCFHALDKFPHFKLFKTHSAFIYSQELNSFTVQLQLEVNDSSYSIRCTLLLFELLYAEVFEIK